MEWYYILSIVAFVFFLILGLIIYFSNRSSGNRVYALLETGSAKDLKKLFDLD